MKDLAQCGAQFTGWLDRLLTHPIQGLARYEELFQTLTTARDAIKVYCILDA